MKSRNSESSTIMFLVADIPLSSLWFADNYYDYELRFAGLDAGQDLNNIGSKFKLNPSLKPAVFVQFNESATDAYCSIQSSPSHHLYSRTSMVTNSSGDST